MTGKKNQKKYQPKEIEARWQKKWAEQRTFVVKDRAGADKRYLLVEFPYPSGDGLHVGHVRSYAAIDALARYSRMRGFNVLYPMGWDAFGLPTENYAIKTGVHPRQATDKNIATFRKQMKSLGLSFDWSREIDTTDPKYYKWTQWIFLQLYSKGLAYQATMPINWCPSCKIGLANEEVVNGKCERCGTEATRKMQKQWLLKITAYADRLLKDLDTVDYLPKIKTQQVNWIGKSEGAEIQFKIQNTAPKKIKFVLLHGFLSAPEDIFYPWLKRRLEAAGYEVIIPRLPDAGNPTEVNQVDYVLKAVTFDKNTILFGHSLGAVVAMKVAEKLDTKIAGLVLAGGFIEPKFKDKPRPFNTTFNWKFDFNKIRRNTGSVTVLSATNDKKVSIEAGKKLAQALNVPVTEVIANGDHFQSAEEPFILDALVPSKEILVGTRNPAKVKMIKQAFKPFPEIRLITLDEIGDVDDTDLVEGDDFRANARLKAEYYFKKTGIPTVSTDHILWLEKWPEDNGFITHIRQLANPKSKRATDDEVAGWLEKLIHRQGESRTAFHYAIGYADRNGVQDFASIQREYILKSNPAKARWEGYVVDRFLRDPQTDEYRATQGEEIAFGNFFDFVRTEFVSKIFWAQSIKVFTTRPDTIFGATYLVLAPEHPIIQKIKGKINNVGEVEKYIAQAAKKSDLDRTDLAKDKTGVELKGVKATNPATNEAIPIWVADYVLSSYGTGAIMAVPAHDERDYEFATKYNLPIRQVIAPYFTKNPEDKDAVRPDKKTVKRKTAYALIYSKKKNAFLCLDWAKYGWRSGIIGGVDEGESYKEAAQREIREETGYQNIRFVKNLGLEQHNNFFAAHKDENRYAYGQGMLFELVDEKRLPIATEHAKHHKIVWIDADKIGEWLNLKSFEYMWEAYKSDSNCFSGQGKIVNSAQYNGQDSREFSAAIVKTLKGNGLGQPAIQYKLRDWVFSRQHYWGEPIPIVHCETCGAVPVPEKDLPVELPYVKKYQPTNTGVSPLAEIKKWVNTKCPVCKKPAKRETDTMPNWAGSSWYYLRYCDPHNDKKFADRKKLDQWLPVDIYNGGMEHTTLHLLYSRFWHKFLYDLGRVPDTEPYRRRHSHGIVLAEDGRKMSKSFGNVINPDKLVKQYGADSLRIYEMFMGPFEDMIPWSTQGLIGVRRFLDKVWKSQEKIGTQTDPALIKLLHRTIYKIGHDLEAFKFNTAVSALMIFVNQLLQSSVIEAKDFLIFVRILAPFAPHLSEELWAQYGGIGLVSAADWPKPEAKYLHDAEKQIIVQVNGRVRDRITVSAEADESVVTKQALTTEKIGAFLAGRQPKKIIYVKGRIINLVLPNE